MAKLSAVSVLCLLACALLLSLAVHARHADVSMELEDVDDAGLEMLLEIEAETEQAPAASGADCIVGNINHCTGETSAWGETTQVAVAGAATGNMVALESSASSSASRAAGFIRDNAKPAEYELLSGRFVANAFMGHPIGNVPSGSKIVCEVYRTGQTSSMALEKASFCWGYIKAPHDYFGGWKGTSSCGWFPIWREKGALRQHAKRVQRTPEGVRPKCGSPPGEDQTGPLNANTLFVHGSFKRDGSTRPVKAGKAGCQAWLNYDRNLQDVRNEWPTKIAAGRALQHRYNVQGAPYALVQSDADPKGEFEWFFVQTKCLEGLPHF